MNTCGTRHPGNEPRTQERQLSASLRGFSFNLVLYDARARAAQKTSNINNRKTAMFALSPFDAFVTRPHLLRPYHPFDATAKYRQHTEQARNVTA
jgi:hypothetical protein